MIFYQEEVSFYIVTYTYTNNIVTCDRSVVFSINKTDHHDITEILLKVALNTINHQPGTGYLSGASAFIFLFTLEFLLLNL
jgi:hypothetical protein